MKKSVWKILVALIFVTVAFSGCAPALSPVPPTIMLSPVPPTIMPSPIPPTFTLEPTSTATSLPSMTPTSIPTDVPINGNHLEIKGSVTDGIYTDPLKNFNCLFPSLTTGPTGKVLEDETSPDGGRVTFFDDFGTLLSVHYFNVGEPPLFENPEKRKTYLEDVLTSLMQSMFIPVSPNSSISHKEFLGDENKEILYAVIYFPQGSTLADSKTHKRLDAMRGAFVLNKGKFVYLLSTQSFVFKANDSGSIENLKKDLQDFYNTCEFK
jgi:hypothetical protein